MDLKETIARAMEKADAECAASFAEGMEGAISDWTEHSAQAVLTAIDAAGGMIVPKEPTEAILAAICGAIENSDTLDDDAAPDFWGGFWLAEAKAAYAAMITAAPNEHHNRLYRHLGTD